MTASINKASVCLCIWLGLGLVLPNGASGADDREFTISAGADFSRGDYGESEDTGIDVDDTDIWYFPLSLKYEQDSWAAKVTVPYLRIEGPGGVTAGDGGPVVTGNGGESTTESGIGDVVVALSYLITPSNESLPFFELTGKVKAPTADEDKGLGTGHWDGSAQLDISKTFGRITPFVTGGYRFRGGLDDGLFASAGIDLALASWLSAGVIYDYSQPAEDEVLRDVDPDPEFEDLQPFDVDDGSELVPYLNFKITDSLRLQTYAVFGLSDSSPDYGGGVSLALSF